MRPGEIELVCGAATELRVEMSSNVFGEDLHNTRHLETTYYVTDTTQAYDFYWDRESGLRVNIGIHGSVPAAEPWVPRDRRFHLDHCATPVVLNETTTTRPTPRTRRPNSRNLDLQIQVESTLLSSRRRLRPNSRDHDRDGNFRSETTLVPRL